MKKLVLVLALMLVAAGFLVMPRMVESTIPSVYYITPNKAVYENVVNCTGTIQSADVRQIVLQSAIVPASVYAAAGDTVEAGEPLAAVDAERTRQLSAGGSGWLTGFSETARQIGQPVDWVSLAAQYGLTAAISGADYGALAEILRGGGALPAGGAVDVAADETILSPISGVISEINLTAGVPAGAATTAFTVIDNKRYKVLAAINESDISKINLGDTARIRGVGFSGSIYIGKVVRIAPVARKTLSGTSADTVVDVEISLDNPDNRLKHGFSAKVEITGGNDYELITVPYEAIRQDENNEEYVYVYQDGKLKKQVVATGKELTDEVEILDGIAPDAIVVFNPGGFVKEGAMIHIKGRANANAD